MFGIVSKRAAFTNVKVRDRVDGSIGHALQEAEVVITNLTQIVFAEIMLPARTPHTGDCILSAFNEQNEKYFFSIEAPRPVRGSAQQRPLVSPVFVKMVGQLNI